MSKYINRTKEINGNALVIEQTLEAFGFTTRIKEVYELDDHIQFCLEIAVGTNLDNILKLDKDLALALASPTGKVEIIAPIPGTSLIGINLPKNKYESTIEKGKLLYKNHFKSFTLKPLEDPKGWRHNVGVIFYKISYLLSKAGDIIIEEPKKK